MIAMIGTRHTFASYFALAVDTILKVLWREGYARGPHDLVTRTWNGIRRLERRFETLVAQWRAGVSRQGAGVREVTPPPDFGPLHGPNSQGEGEQKQRKAWLFPRGRGWVVRLLAPVTGPQCVGMLCVAWEEPEMREVYAAAPQLGRILRPLAFMIGAPVPEWLRLPRRLRVRLAHPSPRPPPTRGGGEGELIVPNRRLPPKEQAEDAIRRSEASGKAIDLKKFRPEAYGWFVHPPRDGNCPPPKIGYAGRRRRPPKDYKPPPKDEE